MCGLGYAIERKKGVIRICVNSRVIEIRGRVGIAFLNHRNCDILQMEWFVVMKISRIVEGFNKLKKTTTEPVPMKMSMHFSTMYV